MRRGNRFKKAWSKMKNWAKRWGRWGQGGGNGGNGGSGGDLTEAEKTDLLFMREEEKMARDVYITLGEQWQAQIFDNISSSEQRHMDSMLKLLNNYGLEDPAANTGIGEFNNADIQKLYDDLVKRGSTSALEAMQVGGVIEETDIRDINAALTRTDKRDITNVYTNLLSGSHNHLRAFARQVEMLTGKPYEAQVISQEEVDAIIG